MSNPMSSKQAIIISTIAGLLLVIVGLAFTGTPGVAIAAYHTSDGRTGGGNLVSYTMTSGEEQFYWPNGDGKLFGIALDDLKNLAGLPVGTTVTFVLGGNTITLTNDGGGHFGGTVNGAPFGFQRNDLASQPQCDAFGILIAHARVLGLPAGPERTIAEAVYLALLDHC